MYHSNIYLMDINIIITPSFSFPFLRVKVKMSQTHDSKIQPVEIPDSIPLIPHLRQEAARLRISRADKTTINRTTAINNLSKFLSKLALSRNILCAFSGEIDHKAHHDLTTGKAFPYQHMP